MLMSLQKYKLGTKFKKNMFTLLNELLNTQSLSKNIYFNVNK